MKSLEARAAAGGARSYGKTGREPSPYDVVTIKVNSETLVKTLGLYRPVAEAPTVESFSQTKPMKLRTPSRHTTASHE